MPTPDEVRAALRAMLNQIPATMVASQVALSMLADLGSVKGEDGEVSVEKLHQMVGKLASTFVNCVIVLDDKLEKVDGRPGIPDEMLESILSEFGLGG